MALLSVPLIIGGGIGTLMVATGTDLGDASLAFPAALLLGVGILVNAIRKAGR